MTDSLPVKPPHPMSLPSRGTQPLAGTFGGGSARDAKPATTPAVHRDAKAFALGDGAIEAFSGRTGSLADLRVQAEALLGELDPMERAFAERIFQDLLDPPAPIRENADKLGDHLKTKLHRLKHHVESKALEKAMQQVRAKEIEREYIRIQQEIAWYLFLESLERYIESIEANKKVESKVSENRIHAKQSHNEHDERLMVASHGQGPENRFSLLSAHLNQS